MPQRVLNREQVRRVDRLAIERYGMTGLVLMENAGRGAAELIAGLGLGNGDPRRPIVIGCGTGNNGGDGFVIARHLDNCGLAVRLLLFGDPQKLTPDAVANYEIARLAGLPIEAFTHPVDPGMLAESLKGAAGLVDALLGTGSHGEPKPPLVQHQGHKAADDQWPLGNRESRYPQRALDLIKFVATAFCDGIVDLDKRGGFLIQPTRVAQLSYCTKASLTRSWNSALNF